MITDSLAVESCFWGFVLRLMRMVNIKSGKVFCVKDSGTPKLF